MASEPRDDLDEFLWTTFGYERFRDGQKDIIREVLANRRCQMVFDKAGSGKSLLYMFPALKEYDESGKTTLVIEPTLSLIRDQLDKVNALPGRAGKAVSLSEIKGDPGARNALVRHITNGNGPAILYATPEAIHMNDFTKETISLLHRNGKLARFAIDESHLVSKWGYTFRPSFLVLDDLNIGYRNYRWLLLSATMTAGEEDRVVTALGLPNAEFDVWRNSILCRNHVISVSWKGHHMVQKMVDFIKDNHEGQSGLIYTLFTGRCDVLAKILKERFGLSAEPYHAKMKKHFRDDVQVRWKRGEIQILVCTVAFGMGIDKPDTRFVIFDKPPADIESFYQQAGRAGRDGELASIVVYHNESDYTDLADMMNLDTDWHNPRIAYMDPRTEWEAIETEQALATQEARDEYKTTQVPSLLKLKVLLMKQAGCRHVDLAEHFGEEGAAPCIQGAANACDNCRRYNADATRLIDCTYYGQHLYNVIAQLRGFTFLQCFDVIMKRGSAKKVKDMHRYRSDLQLIGFHPHTWHQIKDALEALQYISIRNGYPTVNRGFPFAIANGSIMLPMQQVHIMTGLGVHLSQQLDVPGRYETDAQEARRQESERLRAQEAQELVWVTRDPTGMLLVYDEDTQFRNEVAAAVSSSRPATEQPHSTSSRSFIDSDPDPDDQIDEADRHVSTQESVAAGYSSISKQSSSLQQIRNPPARSGNPPPSRSDVDQGGSYQQRGQAQQSSFRHAIQPTDSIYSVHSSTARFVAAQQSSFPHATQPSSSSRTSHRDADSLQHGLAAGYSSHTDERPAQQSRSQAGRTFSDSVPRPFDPNLPSPFYGNRSSAVASSSRDRMGPPSSPRRVQFDQSSMGHDVMGAAYRSSQYAPSGNRRHQEYIPLPTPPPTHKRGRDDTRDDEEQSQRQRRR